MKRVLAVAALLAFAQPAAGETDELGVPVLEDSQEIVETKLIDTPHGAVRITEIALPGRNEPGWLTMTYLARREGDIVEQVDYAKIVETNPNGHGGSWRIDERLTEWPVVVTETGGTWQGQTCQWLTLTELRPTGPYHLTAFQSLWLTDGSVGEPQDVTGEIVAIERGKRFTVRYSGTKTFENTYERGSSEVYILLGEDGNVLEGC